MGNLAGKVAVITGAGSGIGAGIAHRFAADGASVVVADLDDARGKAVADAMGGTFVHCDVALEADLQQAVAAAVDGHGRLDVFVGNAGMGGASGPITELDAAAMHQTIAVLLGGVALGMKHAALAMQAGGGGGSIISTASVAGLQGGLGPHIYSACKAGVIGLTRSVALEQAPFGIRVNCICPGGIVTNIFAAGMGAEGEAAEQVTTFMAGALAQAQPIARAGLPADIAGAAAYLASDDATFVTGQAITVDGGMTATHRSLMAGLADGAAPPT